MLLRRLRFTLFTLCLCAYARQVTVTVLATTDLHGNLLPYDYFTAHAAPRGLAGIATLIAAARAENPNNLLIDCGDTIQGSPLQYVWQYYVRGGRLPLDLHFEGAALQGDPMMKAMNALGYDAMTLGNHEFNYGLKNLEAARSQAHFPWLSANTHVEAGAAVRPFAPYLIKEIAGVKVAIIGVTTPLIPLWEKPENYRGLSFEDGVPAVRAALADLRAKHHPDLVLIAAHSGLDRDPRTGTVHPDDARENMVYEIASEVPGIDAIVFGHTHSQLSDYRVSGVLFMQPKNWGGSLDRMDFTLDDASGHWTVTSKTSRLIPVTADTPSEPAIASIAAPYHGLAERYLNTRVAEAPVSLDATYARVEDTALIDAIQRVQLEAAHADVSFASSFNPRARIDKGPVTIRQIAALYVYDNQLYAIEGTGRMVREALENAARYFLICPDPACAHGPLINRDVIGFNYDMAEGVDYEIDLTRPAGSRIRNLKFHGKPLADDRKLRIAVNNYRAAGSAGYAMFHGAKVVWRSPGEIRDLLISYFTEHKQFPAKADNNWRVVPEAARGELRREAESQRGAACKAAGRLPIGPGAGPGKVFRIRHQPGLDRIHFNVISNPIKLRFVSNQPIITLILPERLPHKPQHPIRPPSSKSLEGVHQLGRFHQRSSQQMYVVRYDNESMELIMFEMPVSIGDRIYNYFSYLRPDEVARAAERVIENAVHGHEFPSSA